MFRYHLNDLHVSAGQPIFGRVPGSLSPVGRWVTLNIQIAWITLFQWCPVPEIAAGGEPLNPGFEFLRNAHPHAYEIPATLPALRSLGNLRPLSAAELNGLDSHEGTERIWKRLDPFYPVQVVPQLEISIARRDVEFLKPDVRIYVHPFGYLATFRTRMTVPAGHPGISGSQVARIISNIERNPTLKIASRSFKNGTRLNALFRLLFDGVSRQMFGTRVRAVPRDESFFCLDLSGNDLPQDAVAMKSAPEILLELASVLNRYTGNQPPEAYDIDKLGTLDVGREAKSGAVSGWSFSARNGFATYIRLGLDPNRARRAALCHHRNVAKLVGMFRLYGSFLETINEQRPQSVPAPVLQAAVDGYDRLAILFSRWWARWGTAVQHLDEPVRQMVEAYGLARRHPHSRNTNLLRTPEAPPNELRKRAFISYSHKDQKWFERLRVHLAPLERELKDWPVWGDDRIKASQVWQDEITKAMREADIAILLLSADFFASEFIANTELPVLLEKAEAGRMAVLTLIVSDFSETFTQRVLKFQGINGPAKPLLKMNRAQRETTFKLAAQRVEELLGAGRAGAAGE